jgi:hypothetical protein
MNQYLLVVPLQYSNLGHITEPNPNATRRTSGIRLASTADGNHIAFAEAIDPDMAR